MNVLDSWHIYCFIVHSICLLLSLLKTKKKTKCLGFSAYLLFYCTRDFYVFFSFFVCRTREWCCINIETRHVHTNTYWSWWLKIALCCLLFGQVVLMMTYWVLLVFILTTYWCVNLTYWCVDFLLLDTSRQWPTYRYRLLFWVLTVAYT